jgi:hypothetical protein
MIWSRKVGIAAQSLRDPIESTFECIRWMQKAYRIA